MPLLRKEMFTCRKGRRAVVGFTLVELMVTLALLALVVTLAVPSFREFNLRSNQSAIVNELVGALNLARSESVKTGRAGTVIRAGANWNAGWRVEIDLNGDATIQGDEILRTHDALPNGYTIVVSDDAESVSFNVEGRASDAVSFVVCRPENTDALARRTDVDGSGRVQSYKGVGTGMSCT